MVRQSTLNRGAGDAPPTPPRGPRHANPGVFRGRARIPIYLLMLPGLIIYLALGIVPSVATAVISLTNYTGVPGIPANFVGIQNYIQAFSIDWPGVAGSLVDTLIFAVAVTVLQNVIALLMAEMLRRRMPGVAFFRALIFLPAVLGVTVVGLVWALIFNPSGGPAANFLHIFHATSAFLGSNTWALPLVIFVQVWSSLGFTVLVYLSGMNAIPAEMYEAAQLDGGSGWNTFRFVTFPMIASSVTVDVLLAAVGSLNVYNLIYVLTDGLYNTNTLGMFMFNSAFQGSGDLGFGATLSMMLFIITLLVALPLQRYLRQREERVL